MALTGLFYVGTGDPGDPDTRYHVAYRVGEDDPRLTAEGDNLDQVTDAVELYIIPEGTPAEAFCKRCMRRGWLADPDIEVVAGAEA